MQRQALDNILDALADDYEMMASLMGEGTAEEYRLGLTREELVAALSTLIHDGLVTAVTWNNIASQFEFSVPDWELDDHALMFGLTKKGENYLAELQDYKMRGSPKLLDPILLGTWPVYKTPPIL